MVRLVLLGLMLLMPVVLTGCSTFKEPTREELSAEDDSICREFGAKPETKAYTDCRLRLLETRNANRRAAAEAFLNRPPLPTTVYTPPPIQRPVNCNSMKVGNMVNTSCY